MLGPGRYVPATELRKVVAFSDCNVIERDSSLQLGIEQTFLPDSGDRTQSNKRYPERGEKAIARLTPWGIGIAPPVLFVERKIDQLAYQSCRSMLYAYLYFYFNKVASRLGRKFRYHRSLRLLCPVFSGCPHFGFWILDFGL
jgi:hypothetical protein